MSRSDHTLLCSAWRDFATMFHLDNRELRRRWRRKKERAFAPSNDNYAADYEEYADHVTRRTGDHLGPSWLDYTDDSWCGEDCAWCSTPHERWMEYLRGREVYPEPPLRVPLFPLVGFTHAA